MAARSWGQGPGVKDPGVCPALQGQPWPPSPWGAPPGRSGGGGQVDLGSLGSWMAVQATPLRGGASLGLGGDPRTSELSLLDKRPDVQPQTAPGPQYQPGSPAGWGDLRIESCVLQILSPVPRNVTRRGSWAIAEATSYEEVPRGRRAPMQSCWRPY